MVTRQAMERRALRSSNLSSLPEGGENWFYSEALHQHTTFLIVQEKLLHLFALRDVRVTVTHINLVN